MKQIAVIDIGTTKVVAIVAQKNQDNKIQILGYGQSTSRGIVNGIIRNIPEALEAIREAVQKAKSQAGDFSEVYIGIAGHYIRSESVTHFVVVETEKVTKNDMQRLLSQAYSMAVSDDEKIIHVIPQEYIIDDKEYTDNPLMMPAKKLGANLLLIKGKETAYRIIESILSQLNITVKKIVLEPLAAAAAVLDKDEKESGVALVDIGGGTTDLIIFKDGKVRQTTIIPFGGNNVTNDIAKGLQITAAHAEKIKVEYAYSIVPIPADKNKEISISGIAGRKNRKTNVEKISKIAFARMLEIVDTIKFRIEEWELRDQLNAGITITGGGSLLRGTETLFRFRTDIDTRIAQPDLNNFVNISEYEFLKNPRYATVIGLILTAFQDYDKNENLKQQNNKDASQEGTEQSEQENTKHKDFFNRIWSSIKSFFIDNSDENLN